MSDIATIQEELERKTLEELERIVHGTATGRMTPTEGAASMQTVWQLVAGLVPRETMELISAVKLPPKSPIDNHVVLVKGATLMYLARLGITVSVTKVQDGTSETKLMKFDDETAALKALSHLLKRSKERGFTKINSAQEGTQ